MSATLDWFVNDSGLNNIKFLVGETQKDNIIISVNILDNPDALRWFKKNELILTTGYVIKDNETLQRRTVRELKEIGCSALAVKINRFFKTVPTAILDEAQKVDLPIIELPFFYSFSDISNHVFTHIYSQKQESAAQEQVFLSELMENYFQHASPISLLQKLSIYLSVPVGLIDLSNKIISLSSPVNHPLHTLNLVAIAPAFETLLPENNLAPMLPITIDDNPYYLHKFPVDDYSGYICILTTNHLLPEETLTCIRKSVKIISLACAHDKSLSLRTNDGNYFMHYLLHHENTDIAELKNICNFYGFNYRKPWLCTTFLYQPDSTKDTTVTHFSETVREHLPEGVSMQLFSNFNLFSIFFFFPAEAASLHAVNSIRTLISNSIKTVKKSFPAGIGTLHNEIKDITLSLNESLQAAGNSATQGNTIASYLHQTLLYMLREEINSEAVKLCATLIAPLVLYDEKNHTDYTETLRIYIMSGLNSSATAQRLFLHRNTVINRLNVIKDILSTDLNDMHEVFLMYMALMNIQKNPLF